LGEGIAGASGECKGGAIMNRTEQVIVKGGRIIRLAPFNMFEDWEVLECPVLHLKPRDGFYVSDANGFAAYDVTALWDAIKEVQS
jgi:hypothetical protein